MNKIIMKDTNNVGVITDSDGNVRGVVRSRGDHDIVPHILVVLDLDDDECTIISVSSMRQNNSWDIVVTVEEPDGFESFLTTRYGFNVQESRLY